jgi:hypothetical protein
VTLTTRSTSPELSRKDRNTACKTTGRLGGCLSQTYETSKTVQLAALLLLVDCFCGSSNLKTEAER